MAKVFTITEGLENMGALKTGGQGSVYKARRRGEIITAVKLLPTPIHSESDQDKNFTSFQNEVKKLKKVNEEPNPNVVKILSSGITDSGSFPFIEMEFIEGPDMEELLKPPHDPIFTIKEAIKVAEQLSHALGHCHRLDVKHGDMKSNNVKFNKHTGNYMLIDFGLSAMSDEQRRTSLRHAGAIEFMAPEQSAGQLLFQTDIYGFGVILFELLAGQVPFPLTDGSESARNLVMISHMEQQPPDLKELRRRNLPDNWPSEKKEREMQVPDWLLSMIYRCLRKKPEERFANGIELHNYIFVNSVNTVTRSQFDAPPESAWQQQAERLVKEKQQLQQQ
ncbi:MAG: serine/threonine protein kinase, partial [Chitinophagaceae bacterium]